MSVHGGCTGIDDHSFTLTTVKNDSLFPVDDCGIVVDDDLFDPHVVDGGGN